MTNQLENQNSKHPARKVKILLAGNDLAKLESLKNLLQSSQGITLTGTALISNIRKTQSDSPPPDVLLLALAQLDDIQSPDIQKLRAQHTDMRVVLSGHFDEPESISSILESGIQGYFPHGASAKLIEKVLLNNVSGCILVPDETIKEIFKTRSSASQDSKQNDSSTKSVPKVQVTPRERDVLNLLARGMSNRAICAELSVAEVTVKKHVQSIIGKMGVKDRTQAALQGVRLGLIK